MARGEATSSDLMRRAREQEAGDGPVMSLERTIYDQTGTLYANLTDPGRRIVGFEPDGDVQVHIFQEGVVILPNGGTTNE